MHNLLKSFKKISLLYDKYKNERVVSSEYGAGYDHEDGEGCTGLHHAAREGHVQIAARLLEAGAQVILYTHLYMAQTVSGEYDIGKLQRRH
jgi:ankyrin repeat protein